LTDKNGNPSGIYRMNNCDRADNALFLYGLSTNGIWLKAGLLAAAFFIVYSDTMLLFVRTWLGRDDYSHGFLVPFISLYFVWHKRVSLRSVPVRPSVPGGLLVTIAGALMLIMGTVSGTAVIQQTSILAIIPGLVLMLLGLNFLKALALPLSYLILMVPILDLLIDRIHWPFQLFSATVAAELLRAVNIPVLRNANYLELPNITLEVANACSGVRYLLSIMAIVIPLAILTLRTWRRRALLVLSAVVVGILANPVRITFAGMWTYYSGKDVHGPFHIFQGLFVSGVGFVFLFLLAWILRRSSPSDVAGEKAHSISLQDKRVGSDFVSKRFNRAWFTAMTLLVIVGCFIYFYNPSPVLLRSPLNNLPLLIGHWKGEDTGYDSEVLPVSGADSEMIRTYTNSSGRKVKLQVAYFDSQQQDKKFIRDKFNMLDDTGRISIRTSSKKGIYVNSAILSDGNRRAVVYYWYDLGGRTIADKYYAKVVTAYNGFVHRRTNGAIIIVSSDLAASENPENVLPDETDFVKEVSPILSNYLR
jgi:EpsI family protein